MYPAPYPTSPYAVPYPVSPLKRGVGGLGTAVSVLLGVDAAVLIAKTVAYGWRYALLTQLHSDPLAVPASAVRTSDTFVAAMSGLHVLMCVAIFVVFLCW